MNKFLLLVFLFASTLLVVDIFTPLDINSLFLFFCILAISISAGVTCVGKVFFLWGNTTAVVTTVVIVIVVGVFKLLFIWRGDWETQTIEFQHRRLSNRVVEFQMMNPGPVSYKKRRINKLKLLPGLSWTTEVPEQLDSLDWKRVDIDVNEMGLKYP
jgi:hypothetical protein